jgi:branched-chain amino acid transport system permease protein
METLRRIALKFALPVAAASAVLLLLDARGIANPYWIQIFSYAAIIAVSSLGLNVIYGFTGLFSLGHAAFYGIGAYTAAALMKTWGGDSQVLFLLALSAGAGAAALAAVIIGIPTLRLTSDYLGIATLGFGIVMKVVFDNADGFLPILGGARGMTGIPRLASPPWVVAALGLTLAVSRNLVTSSYGRALVSIREDETAAAAMGIATFRYKMIGFVTGCAAAGLAGGLYAHLYAFLHPSNFDFFKSVDVLMIVVIGGLGNLTGTLAASFGWVFLLEGLRIALPYEYIELRWVLIPVLLIVTMLLRPQGLFGSRELPFLRSRH